MKIQQVYKIKNIIYKIQKYTLRTETIYYKQYL